MEVITKSARETQKLGEKLAASLKKRDVVALYGELGSGKTTFVQGLARGLGIKKRIISPTFVFIRQYEISPPRCLPRTRQWYWGSRDDGQASPRRCGLFFHIDLYRVDKMEDSQGLGLEELMREKDAIIVVEWAEKIKKILPKKRIEVYFEYVSKNQRKIVIPGY